MEIIALCLSLFVEAGVSRSQYRRCRGQPVAIAKPQLTSPLADRF
jgi:hypothetical protein